MYYIKIPLRHLAEPSRLNVPEDQRQLTWDDRVKGLLQNIATGVIPAWAVDYRDLRNVTLERDEEQP